MSGTKDGFLPTDYLVPQWTPFVNWQCRDNAPYALSDMVLVTSQLIILGDFNIHTEDTSSELAPKFHSLFDCLESPTTSLAQHMKEVTPWT